MSDTKPTIKTLTYEELQYRIQVSGYSPGGNPCFDMNGYAGSTPCRIAMYSCSKPEYNKSKCDPYDEYTSGKAY